MEHRLDVVVFGASGFTGKRIVPKLYEIIKSESLSLTWGIAGRSKDKLREILKETERKTGSSMNHISIIVADTNDQNTLMQMTSRTKVIINAVGPYRFYGEAVVKACLATSTHYLDVTGEPEFMEKIQLYYHQEALKKRVYLISACGMDSIPCDMGAIFMMKNFNGTLNSIVAYFNMIEDQYPGPIFNYATWESAVHGLANYKKLIDIRSKLFSNRLPQCKPKLELRAVTAH